MNGVCCLLFVGLSLFENVIVGRCVLLVAYCVLLVVWCLLCVARRCLPWLVCVVCCMLWFVVCCLFVCAR